MRRAPGLVLLVVGGACSLGEPAQPRLEFASAPNDFTSGARLRARTFEVDGTRVVRDFFDRERNETCAFVEGGVARTGPNASHHCLPVSMAVHDAGLGPFADSSCTKPIAVMVSPAKSAYAIERPVDACAVAPVIRRAGRVETYAPWLLDGTSCIRSTISVTMQALGEVVPLDQFARAEEVVEDRGGRIGSLVVVAADGTRQTVGAFDRQRNEPVRVEDRTGAPARWVPARVAFVGVNDLFFGDSCSHAVPTKTTREVTCPLTAALAFTDACSAGTIEELGVPLDTTLLWGKDPENACTALGRPAVFAFERGRPIPATSIAAASTNEVGGRRVRRRGYAGPDGAVAVWGDLIDGATGQRCTPALAIDGLERCLPDSVDLGFFADAECSVPAFIVPQTGCERFAPARFVRAGNDEGARVYEVTGEIAPAALHTTEGGGCRETQPAVPSRAFAVAERDTNTFPVVFERDD